jgi:uncharacterized Zn finger protein
MRKLQRELPLESKIHCVSEINESARWSSMSLLDVLTLHAVRKLADARTFGRGEAYFHDGAVFLVDADEQEVRASVQGTQRYRMRPRGRGERRA